MAQAIHAAVGFSQRDPEFDDTKQTVVVLKVDDIEKWSKKLQVPHFVFREPYWGGLATSLASTYILEKDVIELELA